MTWRGGRSGAERVPGSLGLGLDGGTESGKRAWTGAAWARRRGSDAQELRYDKFHWKLFYFKK